MEENPHSPYCKICGSCGEDGCCSALSCKQHPGGDYCESYLRDLKFGYIMYKELFNMVSEDPKYKDLIDKLWDENYDIIYRHEKKD